MTLTDFDQFIESLPSLPRKIPEQVKSGNSIVRFGLAKMTTAHAQRAKYKLARYWYIQHDALYARE